MTGEMSAASSWNPTLLVNTESFNTIDVGDGTTDIELRFGTTELRLFWDTGNSRFEFTQSVYVQGALTASGAVIINDDDVGDATLTFGNDAGDETIIFSDSTNQFEISDDAQIGGNLDVNGNETVSGTLEVNDDNSGNATLTFGNDAGDETLIFNDTSNEFDLSDDLNITGTLDTTGNITTDANLTINEDNGDADAVLTFGNDAGAKALTYSNANTRFEFNDDVHITGTLETTSNVTVGGTITLNGVTYTFPEADGSDNFMLTTNGAGALTWENPATAVMSTFDDRYVNTSGDTMTGALSVQANISGSTLRVDGDAAVWGALSVTGALTTEGNLTINQDNGDADAVLTFGNDAGAKTLIYSNTNTRFEFNDDIQTSGNMSGSTLTVDGDVNLHGVTYSFPVTNGDNGQVLTTDGDGNLTWETQTVGVGSGGVLFMAPEYPHAVYFSSGAVSNYIGQMSYDYDETNQENFYRWTSTKGDLQEYWIAVRVRIPDNFSVWDSSEAIQFLYRTTANDAANNFLTMRLYDTAGAEVALTGGNDLYSDNAWTTATVTGPESGGTYTTSEYITIAIKMVANSSGNTDAGYINLNWETSAP